MFVSIHIPKTAGTALARIFEETSNHRVIYDYGTERDLVAARTCPDLVRQNRDFIAAYFQYFHGHFHYPKYADVFPECPVITTVRNPVDRVLSQYRHIAMSGDLENERHRAIMAGKMDVVEFSEFRFIGNAQACYLEGRDIKDYDFVFIREAMDFSLQKFATVFSLRQLSAYLSWADIEAVNSREGLNWTSNAIPYSSADRASVEKNCQEDIELYRKAVEAFGRGNVHTVLAAS